MIAQGLQRSIFHARARAKAVKLRSSLVRQKMSQRMNRMLVSVIYYIHRPSLLLVII